VDLGLLTCRPELTMDLGHVFNYLTGRSHRRDYRTLLVAPANMKRRFLEMIDRETAHQAAGRPAGIIAKMNQLEDRDICRALHAAALSGVPVDLLVRGFSILAPAAEVGGNLRVTSIVGRYLEHSRIFYFRNGAKREVDGEFYLGSADWMHRNLDSRVEVVTPIADGTLRQDLWEILGIYLADHRSAWDMQADGSYVQRRPQGSGPASVHDGAQQALMLRARREAKRRAATKRR
jgi:polyphosphate kinase